MGEQTKLYSEFLITKAKRLDIDPELKEKIIAMLTKKSLQILYNIYYEFIQKED